MLWCDICCESVYSELAKKTACNSVDPVTENPGEVIRQSLGLVYSLCVAQGLEERDTEGFKFCLRNKLTYP